MLSNQSTISRAVIIVEGGLPEVGQLTIAERKVIAAKSYYEMPNLAADLDSIRHYRPERVLH